MTEEAADHPRTARAKGGGGVRRHQGSGRPSEAETFLGSLWEDELRETQMLFGTKKERQFSSVQFSHSVVSDSL